MSAFKTSQEIATTASEKVDKVADWWSKSAHIAHTADDNLSSSNARASFFYQIEQSELQAWGTEGFGDSNRKITMDVGGTSEREELAEKDNEGGYGFYNGWEGGEERDKVVDVERRRGGGEPIEHRQGSLFTRVLKANAYWLYQVPWILYKGVTYIKDRYGNPPVILSENGMDDPGNVTPAKGLHDVNFYKSYITQLKKAADDGANVVGYIAWSLLDNFEWRLGYTSRFGIVYIDFKTLKRYPKVEDVKADKSKIAADALLPHEILYYVVDPIVDEPYLHTPDVDYSDVAELQWKAMVEGLSNKGKLKNCLAVCGLRRNLYGRTYYEVSVAMGILMSQLSDQEPWKGKVIPFTRSPEQLHLIQGNDLKSKRAFLRGMESRGDSTTAQKVLDLVLQKAVDANSEPEQMIKKVLVFAELEYSNMSSTHADHWPITYQAMRSKFEEKDYAVPHIVFWELCHTGNKISCSQLSGMTTTSGYSDNFLKLFLDREGDVGPDHAMEAAICGKEYQNLVVVD